MALGWTVIDQGTGMIPADPSTTLRASAVAAMLLRGLGVEPGEADAIARTPLSR